MALSFRVHGAKLTAIAEHHLGIKDLLPDRRQDFQEIAETVFDVLLQKEERRPITITVTDLSADGILTIRLDPYGDVSAAEIAEAVKALQRLLQTG